MLEMVRWDLDGRNGRLPPVGRELVVHEFDYRGENEAIYDENGVVIRSFPAIHVIDDPVSFPRETEQRMYDNYGHDFRRRLMK